MLLLPDVDDYPDNYHDDDHVCAGSGSDNNHPVIPDPNLTLPPSSPELIPQSPATMAGETEVETPAQPEVTEEKKEIAEAENKTEEKKGGDSMA